LLAAFAVAAVSVHTPDVAHATQPSSRRRLHAREVRVLLSSRPAAPAPAPASTTTTAATSTTVALPGPPVVIDHGPTYRRAIALTFDSNLTDAMIRELDDGRVASFDNVAVIDELDAMQVPATFFLAGLWMERYPDTTARLAADPLFELGSHSYAHRAFHTPCYGLGPLPVAEMAADILHSEDVLRRFTDHPTPFFRFPGDCYDRTALAAIAPAHVVVIGVDVASGDAFGTSVRAIVDTVLAQVHNGSIVVMHVTGGNTAPLTADALPDIVNGLRGRGYALVTVSDLLRDGV
jgi:peptidoglycan-N-acetylglucosamine deacetylase